MLLENDTSPADASLSHDGITYHVSLPLGELCGKVGCNAPATEGVSLPSVSLSIFQCCLGLLATEAGRPTGTQVPPAHCVSTRCT